MRFQQCPYCEFSNTVGAKFCNECGARLRLKPCPKCGMLAEYGVEVCASCGADFPKNTGLEAEPLLDVPLLNEPLLDELLFDVTLFDPPLLDELLLDEAPAKATEVFYFFIFLKISNCTVVPLCL